MLVITRSLLQTCMHIGLNVYAENRLATLDQLQLDRKKNNVALLQGQIISIEPFSKSCERPTIQ